jgi:hypothetical protein
MGAEQQQAISPEITATLHGLPVDALPMMRDGRIIEPTKGLMRSEVNVIKRALRTPREKPDTVSFLFSVVTILIACVKSLIAFVASAGTQHVAWFDGILIVAGAGAIPLLISRYFAQRAKKHDVDEIAIGYVNDLFPDDMSDRNSTSEVRS